MKSLIMSFYENLTRNKNRITLYYEELATEPLNKANQIISNLKLPVETLTIINEKINHRPLSKPIINYNEIKRTLENNKNSWWLDE